MTLHVDCDDTLAIYLDSGGRVLPGQHPYGMGADRWVPHDDLVAAVNRYHAETDEDIFIWSGGGRGYARNFMDLLFSGCGYTAMSKGDKISHENPARFVDDDIALRESTQEILGKDSAFTADQFVTYVQERFGP